MSDRMIRSHLGDNPDEDHTSSVDPVPLVAALEDARSVELALLAGLTDDQLLGERAHFIEPPIWEMGHVGWFQEYWIARHLDGAAPLMRRADAIYDAFNVSYRQRWDHAFPSRHETLDYITTVLRRSVERLHSKPVTARDAYFYTLTALHEDMHTENLTLIIQTHGYARPRLPRALATPGLPPPVDLEFQPHDVAVPGGRFCLGASPDEPFVFDNEKWEHSVDVAPFRIAATPVTNADFQQFVDADGYRRRDLWSRRGWDWRRRQKAEHPMFWQRSGGRWYECRFGEAVAVAPWQPVVHVNWYEAEAYCRWAKRRLPTEAEWEMAATLEPATGRKRRFPWGDTSPTTEHANLDFRCGAVVDVRAFPAGDSPVGCRQMIGNVWEWVADTFDAYPGFECDPYKEYSEPYFGTKKVLRGGCWTTRSRLTRSTWRNFYMRQRRNIYAGFRTVAL